MPSKLVLSMIALGLAACGDDLPDPPPEADAGEAVQDSSSSSTTGVADPSTTSSTSAAPVSTDEGGHTTTSSSSSGPSTVGIPDECTVSAECPEGELCVAPFDQEAGPEGKGPLECVTECVVIMDESRWCADAAACCDLEAECTDRGYCVYPEGTGGSESSGSSTGGSTMG